jgi:Reverse transcriptase (RNA-dependent DNA polymerase)
MCLLWKESCILVIYTDDTIVAGKDCESAAKVINEISTKFTITSNDKISHFLGVNISFATDNNQITFSQPQLIKTIINDLGLNSSSKPHRTPSVKNVVLNDYPASAPHNESWSYRSIIEELNYVVET